jgi:hypothetical protein
VGQPELAWLLSLLKSSTGTAAWECTYRLARPRPITQYTMQVFDLNPALARPILLTLPCPTRYANTATRTAPGVHHCSKLHSQVIRLPLKQGAAACQPLSMQPAPKSHCQRITSFG